MAIPDITAIRIALGQDRDPQHRVASNKHQSGTFEVKLETFQTGFRRSCNCSGVQLTAVASKKFISKGEKNTPCCKRLWLMSSG